MGWSLRPEAWLLDIDEFAQYRTRFSFLFFQSGINRSDPMSAAAYGSGLRALSADSTKKNCSHPLTSCCRGVKCSGFPSWEEGKNILEKFKKKLCSLILVSSVRAPGSLKL